MKVLKWILIVILALLVLLIVVGYTMPREVVVTTSEEIALPPQKVFHFVAGFVDRTAWDPWIKVDTATKCSFDIKQGYVGSKYSWTGPKIGSGSMQVDSVVIGSYILNSVNFTKGAPIPEIWTFAPSEKGTSLTWTIKMSSASPVGRIMNSMFKGMIQKTIESGKGDLKNYLESHGVIMSSVSEIGVEEFPEIDALVSSVSGNMQQVATLLSECYSKVFAEIQKQSLQPQGSPFAYYSGYDPETGIYTMTAGMPVSSGAKSSGDVKAVKYKAFKAVKALHTGPYDEMQPSYEAIMEYAKTNNLKLGSESWEFYMNDPSEIKDPTLLQTIIAMPVK